MNHKIRTKLLGVSQLVVLILLLSISALIFQRTFSNLNRFFIITITSVLYVIWGYWHHMSSLSAGQKSKEVYRAEVKLVLIEYSLVSLVIILLSAFGLGIIRFF